MTPSLDIALGIALDIALGIALSLSEDLALCKDEVKVMGCGEQYRQADKLRSLRGSLPNQSLCGLAVPVDFPGRGRKLDMSQFHSPHRISITPSMLASFVPCCLLRLILASFVSCLLHSSHACFLRLLFASFIIPSHPSLEYSDALYLYHCSLRRINYHYSLRGG